ncbi:hypothetical protein EKG39_18390 [Shewanella atlantica]|uniref:Type II toxin-antitoxin system HicA family toxin n=1 Tax=Shewanella atlantica TaxID=271099 RepID=A0A431W0N9_9GAMM|nr:hypothetical protein EKG39_18390 [Shewanella atlantica]
MKRFSKDKDINSFIRQLIKSDKWYCLRGKKHNSVFSPKGKRVTVPSTPSDRRAYINFKKDIERVISCEAA